MNKFTCMLAGVSMLVIAGGVSAEPVTLTAAQMDDVNAGGIYVPAGAAEATAGAGTVSNLLGFSAAKTGVIVTPSAGFVGSSGESGAIAVSTYNPVLGSANGAFAASGSESSAAMF